MVIIKDKKGKDLFAISKKLHRFAMRVHKKINEDDQEFWCLFQGDTGTGKSLAAQRFGYVVDPTLCVNRVCFDVKEFVKAIIDAPKHSCVIADEGVSIFFSRASMTKEGRLVAELSAQIRQKNLLIIICVPEALSMDWLILNKLNLLVNVWESRDKDAKGITRTVKGNMSFYPNFPSKPLIKFLLRYLRLKRHNPSAKVRKVNAYFREKGNMIYPNSKPAIYPVGEKAYREKKESVLKKYLKGDKEKPLTALQKKQQRQRNEAWQLMKEQMSLNNRELSKMVNAPIRTVIEGLKSLEIQ